ncbi:hypothetical protein [Pseudomonas faucium]|uniref:hypothetical protein n=1 Tax=Pseudomonas faucium TaxID=2740518 RepID=UPI0039C1EF40
MKKIALFSVLALCLSACDAPDVAKIDLKEGQRVSFNNVKSTKSYMATKDDMDRQYHFFAVNNDLNAVYKDFSQSFEKNGYKTIERKHDDALIQAYYKKPNAALIVANFKKTENQPTATQTVISWVLN